MPHNQILILIFYGSEASRTIYFLICTFLQYLLVYYLFIIKNTEQFALGFCIFLITDI